PTAGRARGRDDLPAPTAGGAHLRERERPLVDRDRAAAMALRTGLRMGSRSRARAVTRVAGRVGAEPHGAGGAAHCVVERQVQLGLEVLPALRTSRPSLTVAATTAEESAEQIRERAAALTEEVIVELERLAAEPA